jgi:DNA uptake protein ComE-like DNA-binding protein
MYVYYGDRFINQELLEKGYARLSDDYPDAQHYGGLWSAEQYAASRSLGRWAFDEGYKNYYQINIGNYGSNNYYYNTGSYYSGYGVNINTASAAQLRSMLLGVSDTIVGNIISYRNSRVFYTVNEIRNVPGFTQELYDRNVSRMKVVTNINWASVNDLMTLGLTQYEAERVVASRANGTFANTSRLYTENIISQSRYEQIRRFISVTDVSTVY